MDVTEKDKSSLLIHSSGMTLASMLIGLALSSFLILGLGELLQVGSKSQKYTNNMNQLNANALSAIRYLNAQLSMSGHGMAVPTTLKSIPPANAGAPQMAIPGWTYIGCFTDTNSSLFSTNSTSGLPSKCAKDVPATSNFFGMMNGGTCYKPTTTTNRANLLPKQSSPNTCSTACSTNSAYNCGGPTATPQAFTVYERIIPHSLAILNDGLAINGTTVQGQKSDSISMHMTNPSGQEPLTDCLGNPMTGNILQNFSIVAGAQVQCNQMTQSATPIIATANPTYANNTPVLNGVEYMKVLVGESDYDDGAVSRYLAPGDATIDPTNIISLRIALVMVTQDVINPIATPAPSPVDLMAGPGGTMLTYDPPNDGKIRKVFVTTIYFEDRAVIPYENHCVLGTGGAYYIKTGGVRNQNQTAPASSDTGTYCTNGTTNFSYNTLALCENNKNAITCGIPAPTPPAPTCTGGQTWNGSACACPSGRTWNGSACVCPSNQPYVDPNTGQCSLCPTGEFQSGDKYGQIVPWCSPQGGGHVACPVACLSAGGGQCTSSPPFESPSDRCDNY